MFMYSANIITDTTTLSVDPWVPFSYNVVSKTQETEGLFTLTLEPEGNQAIKPIQPGQFNMLYVFGIGEIPISVSSLAEEHPKLTHTIAAVGPVSNACVSLKIGDSIGVRGPFGSTWPLESAKGKDIIIMAGGVGFAPIRPLIEEIIANRMDFNNVNILYGTRDPGMIIFHQDIISLQADSSLNFLITVDHSFTNWHGNVGVVTNLIDQADFDPDNTVSYLCGPEIMMRYGAYSIINAGIPSDQIFLSMERNMKCGIGHCGHCQYGSFFVCMDGPVFSYPQIESYFKTPEL